MSKLFVMLKVLLKKDSIKLLLKIYRHLAKDPFFTPIRAYRLIRFFLEGEKVVDHKGQLVISTFMPPFPSEATFTHATAVSELDKVFELQAWSRRTAPISMYLCVTNRCPFNCIYCSAKGRTGEEELTTAEWKAVISELQNMHTSIIGITGGEPLLRKDIVEILASIDGRSSSILFTSGHGLDLEMAKRLKGAGLFAIGISLDSVDEDKHNSHRQSGRAFELAKQAFANAREAGLYTMAQTVIVKDEVDQEKLFGLFEFAKKLGAHEVKILEPIQSGELLRDEKRAGVLYDQATRERLIAIQERANRIGRMPKITTFAYTEHRNKYGCGAGTQHSYISSNGELYPCDFVPISFGSVKEESVQKLWNRMNHKIGIPKTECFANSYNKELLDFSGGVLPLRKNAEAFVQNRQSKEFPRFYREIQK